VARVREGQLLSGSRSARVARTGWRALVLAVGVLLARHAPVCADLVHLKDGRVLDGEVTEAGDQITIAMRLGTVTVPRSSVLKIERRPTVAAELARRRAALSAGDVEGRVELAKWCAENKRPDDAQALYAEVVALDPQHAVARAALGHVYQDGAWLSRDEAMKKAGFVQHQGKWILPEERDAIERKAYLAKAKVTKAELADELGGLIHLAHPTLPPRSVSAKVVAVTATGVVLEGEAWAVRTEVLLATVPPLLAYRLRLLHGDPGDATLRAALARDLAAAGFPKEAAAEAAEAARLDPRLAPLAKELADKLAGAPDPPVVPPATGANLDLASLTRTWQEGHADRAIGALGRALAQGLGAKEREARELLGRWTVERAGWQVLAQRLAALAGRLDPARDAARLAFLDTLARSLGADVAPLVAARLGAEPPAAHEVARSLACALEVAVVYKDEPAALALDPARVLELERWFDAYRAELVTGTRRALRKKLVLEQPDLPIEAMAAVIRRGRRYPVVAPGSSVQPLVVAVGGEKTEYSLHVPAGYSPLRPAPLLVYLHGTHGSGAEGIERLAGLAEDEGWLLACPTATAYRHRGWGGTEGEHSAPLSTVDAVRERLNVDPARIYLAGASMGGHGTWSTAMHVPDRFAAIFPIIGGPRLKKYRIVPNLQHTAVFDAQGALDDPLLVEGVRYAMRLLDGLGYAALYREYPGVGHAWPPGVEREFARWVEGRRKPAVPTQVHYRSIGEPHVRAYWIELVEFDQTAVSERFELPPEFNGLEPRAQREQTIRLFDERVAEVKAERLGSNVIDIRGNAPVKAFRVYLVPPLVDLSQPVQIRYNGKVAFEGVVAPSLDLMLEVARIDRDRIYHAGVDIRAR